jgi:hypothetical protein
VTRARLKMLLQRRPNRIVGRLEQEESASDADSVDDDKQSVSY